MAPEAFVRFLSEFVEPGGRLWFGAGDEEQGWTVEGQDAVHPIEGG
jgi:hypothetical protein